MKPEQTQFLMDVMCTAFEGGINYWVAEARNVQRTVGRLDYVHYELRAEDEDKWHTVTPDALDLAIRRILNGEIKINRTVAAQFIGYPGNIDMTNHDAEGADCAVQVACFGEIVYG